MEIIYSQAKAVPQWAGLIDVDPTLFYQNYTTQDFVQNRNSSSYNKSTCQTSGKMLFDIARFIFPGKMLINIAIHISRGKRCSIKTSLHFGVRSIDHLDAQKWLIEIIFKKLFFQCRVLRYGPFDTLNAKVLEKIFSGGLFRTPPPIYLTVCCNVL